MKRKKKLEVTTFVYTEMLIAKKVINYRCPVCGWDRGFIPPDGITVTQFRCRCGQELRIEEEQK